MYQMERLRQPVSKPNWIKELWLLEKMKFKPMLKARNKKKRRSKNNQNKKNNKSKNKKFLNQSNSLKKHEEIIYIIYNIIYNIIYIIYINIWQTYCVRLTVHFLSGQQIEAAIKWTQVWANCLEVSIFSIWIT